VVLLHLKMSIFAKQSHVRTLSGNLVYLIMEGNQEARKLLEALVPKGVMQLYANKVVELQQSGKVHITSMSLVTS
jgi:DnaJ family protein C protein 13